MLMLSAGLAVAMAAETFDGQTFYFGDLHSHTGISPDGSSSDMFNCDDYTKCGSLADAFQTAKDNGLDFVAFTDHSVAIESEFDDFLQRIWDEKATYSPLVVIPAAERVLRLADGSDVGHKSNLLFQDDDTLLEGSLSVLNFRGEMKTFRTCRQVWGHPAEMTDAFGPTLEFAHHPAAGNIMATDWSCHDQTYEPVVEVFSGWGNSLEFSTDYDPLQFPVEDSTVHEALETYGLRVGFVGGTDNHDTQPGAVCAIDSSDVGTHIYGGGLTVVALPEGQSLDRLGIYDELVARRSLVTTGPPMPALVEWITNDGVTHAIGEQLHVDDTGTTTLSVKVPSGWEGYVVGVPHAVGYDGRVDLDEVSAGEWSVSFPNDELPKWLYAEVEIDGASYYGGVGVCDDGGLDDREFVWSSPTWFERDADGDGFYTDVDCDDASRRIHPGRKEIGGNAVDEDCDGRVRL
jgi:hypothetical protein